MTRYKWMSAEFGVPLATIAGRMRKTPFVADPESDTQGFRIQERKGRAVSGQFIERETWIEEIHLPTGEEYQEPRTRVHITEFVLSDAPKLNLLLLNAPRRSLTFLNALSEAAGFDCTIDGPQANVLKWVESVEDRLGPVRVTYAECSGVQLSSTVVGRFAFKGSDDVRQELVKTLKKGTPTVEAVACLVTLDGHVVQLELFRQGSAKMDGDFPELVSVVGEALQKAI